jgi:hypothetical protein
MSRGWGRPFDDQIEADDRKLVTLRDAGEYIAAFPKREHDAPEWHAAMEALMLVVERGGPTADSARYRPAFRDDLAHHSDLKSPIRSEMMSPTIPG